MSNNYTCFSGCLLIFGHQIPEQFLDISQILKNSTRMLSVQMVTGDLSKLQIRPFSFARRTDKSQQRPVGTIR